ncbi:hypothetical protein ABKN59_004670 [Abortiporus biennis]
MAALWSSSLRHVAVAARALHTQAAAAPSTTTSALSLVRSQPSQYVVASVAGRKYLLAPKDLLTVPRLKDVRVEATVVEHTKGKMEVIFKKKRRKGYQKTITHKQTYTRLRIGAIDVLDQ